MKFTCEKSIIQNAISRASSTIETKNQVSILSNVLLQVEDDHLKIQATDLKVSYETTIPIENAENGSITTICDKFTTILNNLPDEDIEFSLNDKNLFCVKSNNSKKINFELKTMQAENYPELPTVDKDKYFTVPQNIVSEMIKQTIFSVSDDETRHFMNGVAFEKEDNSLVMVSTDGKRLAYIKKEIESQIPEIEQIIIPPKFLRIVQNLSTKEGSMDIAITGTHIFIEFDGHKLSAALIDGPFPKYKRVIPEDLQYQFVIDRLELKDSLRRVSLMVEKSRRVYLDMKEKSLRLRSDLSDYGSASEELDYEYNGDESTIALNFTFISDPVRVIDTDKICVQFTESSRAISITPFPTSDYFHVVMPMNLND